jgi:hypothetical protein
MVLPGIIRAFGASLRKKGKPVKTTTLHVSYSIVVNRQTQISTIGYRDFPIGVSISRALFNQLERITRDGAKHFHGCCEYELNSFKILGITPIEEP